MKIAYLILAHAHPEQLSRLVRRLDQDNVHFFIHIDANTPTDVFAAMQAAAPHATWADRRPCRWGGFSLVAASLQLIELALAQECDWLVLLSGQDYPLKTNAQITEALTQSPFVAHMDMQANFDVRYRWQNWYPERLGGTRTGKLLQKIQRFTARLGLRRALPNALCTIEAGSQWWMLSRTAAQSTLEFLKTHPEVTVFFKTTLVPDEMFFQTVLVHCYPRERIGSALRLIEWEEGSWSPKEFHDADAARLKASTALFARKFGADGTATAALDALLDQN